MYKGTSEGPPATPAATVIVARDGDVGLEILLLQRSDVGAFAGMWVFPGGRVDDTDPGDDEVTKARHTAVREAHEEVGVRVPVEALVPFSHWTPPTTTPNRRFATWFFVAPWSGDDVAIDGHEIVDHRWLPPLAAVEERLPLAPPTWVTLHHLAAYGTLAAIQAAPPVVERYLTQPAKVDDMPVLLWHGDVGYGADAAHPATDGPRHRLYMPVSGTWRYERSPA